MSHPACDARFLVLIKRDSDPVDVTPFHDEDEARGYYEYAGNQWAESYLCRIIVGPPDACEPEERPGTGGVVAKLLEERRRLRERVAELESALFGGTV